MITPLMHILSCLNESYEVEKPVDILYLNRVDRELIVGEARRLGKQLLNGEQFLVMPSDTGLEMVGTVQSIAGEARTISPFTALLLTKARQCFPVYLRELDSVSTEVIEDDLSTDAVVLRLEGNPKYVYYYVYNVMQTPSLSYDGRIGRLKELLYTIQSHVVIRNESVTDGGMTTQKKYLMSRLELQSHFQYWRGMLLSEYIRYYGVVPPEITEETLEVIKKELWDLGFYGFVNPLKMYLDFNNSRVSRKIEVTIEDWVIDFLTKIVLSGGATLE